MALRFFADHCVSNLIIQKLQDAGHDVFRLQDLLPPDSVDAVVIAKAQEIDCILVSLNGDFADIVTYPPANYKGIIALQVRNHPEILPMLMNRLVGYLGAMPEMEQYKGRLFVVEVNRTRIRE